MNNPIILLIYNRSGKLARPRSFPDPRGANTWAAIRVGDTISAVRKSAGFPIFMHAGEGTLGGFIYRGPKEGLVWNTLMEMPERRPPPLSCSSTRWRLMLQAEEHIGTSAGRFDKIFSPFPFCKYVDANKRF